MKLINVISKIIFVLVLVVCITIEAYINGAFSFWEQLDSVKGQTELADYINEKLLLDEKNISIYTNDVSEKDIKNMNRNLNGFLGVVANYTIVAKRPSGKMKLNLKLEPSENHYVWNRLVLKKSASNQNITEKEKKLYTVTTDILKETIKDGMSDFEKEKAIHDYVVLHCAYAGEAAERMNDASDDVYKAYGALVNGSAVCNGYAEAMYLLLNASGIECKMIVGTADGRNHAWNLVKLENQWMQLDTTWDDPAPDTKGFVHYNYFNLTDEQMAQSHKWNAENYPVCNVSKYNYYEHYKLVSNSYDEFKKLVEKHIKKEKKVISILARNYNKKEYDFSFVLDEFSNVSKASYTCEESAQGMVVTLYLEY